MTFTDAVRHILSGATLTDVGQLSAETVRWLRHARDKGFLTEGQNTAYPRWKPCWLLAGKQQASDLRRFLKRESEAGRAPNEDRQWWETRR